ncbi:MAG: hypothetical protein K0R29_254 [Pseudobdellovibrio sp.]|jgi:hypothetical protein|nr:hypothetical protein [Pseudobdellovibrio sp.]
MKGILALSVVVLMVSLTAEANRNQNREHRQQGRIKAGVASGELTKREARKLRKGQKHIDHLQQKAMADGVLSPEEKARIEKAQDRQNKKIYKQKHDGQDRNDNAATPAQPAAPNGPGTPATPATPAEPANN